MVIKIEELGEADFVDEWECGFGWVARPEENMQRTSHAFVDEDGGLYLVDPLHAENLDKQVKNYDQVNGIVILFDRHERDSEKLAEKYDCPIYIPEWMEKSFDAEVKKVEGKLSDTDWKLIDSVNTFTGREAGLYHEKSGTLIVADALGTVDMFCGRGEVLGINPLYRLTPPKNLQNFDTERIFCGHGEGIKENSDRILDATLNKARRKTPSAYIKAFSSLI